jgi:hypothetical protein
MYCKSIEPRSFGIKIINKTKTKMNINRNNYEHFFLLYADGELRADERRAVEDFINENEDVRIELEMLQATVLPNEEISFADKSFLYKEIIFDSKIQEQLLLKIDNELGEKELANINVQISANVDIKNEYDSLSGTKLDTTEKIVFEEKHLLYKRERDNVIIFRFARWAAAAALIGFGLFFGMKFFGVQKSNPSTEIANNKKVENNISNNNKTIDFIDNNEKKENITVANNDNIEKRENVNTVTTKITIENKVGDAVAVEKKENNVNKKPITQKSIQTQEQNITNPAEGQIALIKKGIKIEPVQKYINTEIPKEQIAAITEKEKIKQPTVEENIVPLEDTYAKTVALSSIEKSENKILYMDEDDVKRSKAGGFFRKIKRFVTRTANIKSGNTLQIAGFEIASK